MTSRAEVADRRTQALALRVAGLTNQAIADRLGHKTAAAASQDITRALEQRHQELGGGGAEVAALGLERLDAMERAAWAALRRPHILVSQGRVIRDDQGRPVTDDDPALRAIDRLIRIHDSRERLIAAHGAPAAKEASPVDDLRARRAARAAARTAAAAAAVPPAG